MSAYDFLSQEELQEIEAKLPLPFAALKERYPIAIAAVARDWDKPSYPEGYCPKRVEVYYNDMASTPAFCVDDGQLTFFQLDEPDLEPRVTIVDIDDETAYVEIEGRTIFNRLGGAILPEVAVNPEKLLTCLLPHLYDR